MARAETNIVNSIMQHLSPKGVRLWKNIRGKFKTFDGRRTVLAGLLAPGASDLVGFVPVTVTPDLLGKTFAVICVIEVKTATGTASQVQKDYIKFIRENGGFAGVARSAEEAEKIISDFIK